MGDVFFAAPQAELCLSKTFFTPVRDLAVLAGARFAVRLIPNRHDKCVMVWA
jgi:hypothetical protein